MNAKDPARERPDSPPGGVSSLGAMGGFRPKHWVSLSPNGAGHVKPNHFGDMLRIAWQNRDALPYAWRILNRGVCDGCALGTTGLKDWTMPGVHLCTVRLELLRLNTQGALDSAKLADVAALRRRSGKELRSLGRLAHPMVRRRGETGFTRVSWDEALSLVAGRLGPVLARDPDRFACFVTSRGLTNETFYAVQKAVRRLGTNNVDNSARLCHAPSTTVLRSMIGASVSTCSYTDWLDADLVVLVGTDLANNQPVSTKYLYYAKHRGARIAVVNPVAEPGLMRYWIPSVAESALFGTKLADDAFTLDQGGDAAFFSGVLKALLATGDVDRAWIEAHAHGFAALEGALTGTPWETIEAQAGSSRAEIERFARLYAAAKRTVFVWSMGVTQHAHGSDNVRAIVNLALARGMVGREGTGLMPIRGHSGVQGGAEVGCVPNQLPGGAKLDADGRSRLAALWGFMPPERPGLDAREMIDAAFDGRIDAFWIVGGNFMETLPDPARVEAALGRVALRVHQDLVLTHAMLVDPADVCVLLPGRTRYEQDGGGTVTTTERRVVYSPRVPGPVPGEARNEWEPILDVLAQLQPGAPRALGLESAAAIRAEMARAVPAYAGVESFARAGDQLQVGGRLLCDGGTFPTADGRATFVVVPLVRRLRAAGTFTLTTRRGKQFNSMVQAGRDPLTGALRNDILVHPEDAIALGLADGEPIRVTSATGTFDGFACFAPIARGNVQGFWPEVNVLLPHDRFDAPSGVPDYGTDVTLARRPTEEP